MIKAILFDFDGVIVESVDIKTVAFKKLFEAETKKVIKKIEAYHLKNLGVSRYTKIKFIYKNILRRSLDDDSFKRLCDKFAILVIDAVVDAPYVKGAKEFLERHALRYDYFIVSATPQDEIEEIINQKKIDKFFKAIYGAPIEKAEATKEIISKEKLESFEAIYVGDAISDYEAARDNALNFIARIHDNDLIFNNINCIKIRDLTGLDILIEALR